MPTKSIALASYPVADESWFDDEAEAQFEIVMGFVRQIRRMRAMVGLTDSQKAPVTICPRTPEVFALLAGDGADIVACLGKVSHLTLIAPNEE